MQNHVLKIPCPIWACPNHVLKCHVLKMPCIKKTGVLNISVLNIPELLRWLRGTAAPPFGFSAYVGWRLLDSFQASFQGDFQNDFRKHLIRNWLIKDTCFCQKIRFRGPVWTLGGRFWSNVGSFLRLWGHLGHLGALWGHLGVIWGVSGAFWSILGRFWELFGVNFGNFHIDPQLLRSYRWVFNTWNF